MFKRRYGIKPVFDDPDFDMPAEVQKFWTKTGVLDAYFRQESIRRHISAGNWHYIIVDARTSEDITDEVVEGGSK